MLVTRKIIEIMLIFFVELQNIFDENDNHENNEMFSFWNQRSINKSTHK